MTDLGIVTLIDDLPNPILLDSFYAHSVNNILAISDSVDLISPPTLYGKISRYLYAGTGNTSDIDWESFHPGETMPPPDPMGTTSSIPDVWHPYGSSFDDVGKLYHIGVDRGVLYPDGMDGVLWNGLININEKSSGSTISSYYMDGFKYSNVASSKEFKATIEAFTYPDQFSLCEGWGKINSALYLDEQESLSFGLSYRTIIGRDRYGGKMDYQIHLIYGAIAVPSDRSHKTVNSSPDPDTFSWDIETTPQLLDGYRPLSHVVIDARQVNSNALMNLESILYGIKENPPTLPPIAEIVGMLS